MCKLCCSHNNKQYKQLLEMYLLYLECVVANNKMYCSYVIILVELNKLAGSRWRVPVRGKSSVCLICMKYRIIMLIIIIISLCQILLSYISNTSRPPHARVRTRTRSRAHTHAPTHARPRMRPPQHPPTHPHTHTHTHTHTAVAVAIRWRPTVAARSAGENAGRLPLQ